MTEEEVKKLASLVNVESAKIEKVIGKEALACTICKLLFSDLDECLSREQDCKKERAERRKEAKA